MSKFIDRKRELGFLKEKYESKNAELVVLYGRRRIGKTELLVEFSKGKNAMYFIGRAESHEDTMRRLNLSAMEFFKDVSLARTPFSGWDGFFDYLAQKADERLVLIIDEFPVIVDKFPEILSVMRDKWDSALGKTKLMIVLCGSSISMMEKCALDYKSPIYGRRTGQWMVDRLDVVHLREFFPKYSAEDIVILHSAIDAIPGYLAKFEGEKTIWENIERKMLSKGEFLYEEVEILLREEFRDPSNYMSILSAVAGGLTSFNDVYNRTGLDKSLLSKYFFILEKVGIVEKTLPITENVKRRLKAKGVLYSLKDNFFDFWFRFVYPNMAELEKGNSAAVASAVKKEFPDYSGKKFERFVTELFPHLGVFKHTKIGRWWHKDKEIDVLALNDNTKEIMFCECKWSDNVDARKMLAVLREKAKFVQWNSGKRKEHYAIFAKSFRERIREPDILLFDLKDLEKAFG